MEYDSEEEVYDSDVSLEEAGCTLFISKHLVPKITTRKRNKCEARWISLGSFAGMAGVLKFKGNHLKSTGIVRDCSVLLHVEEIGYLMQQEALSVQNGDLSLTIMDIYSHLLTGQYGCTWEAFKVYLELKTLGYIVGRHDVLWSNSSKTSRVSEKSYEQSSDEVSSSFERLQLMGKSCIVHGKEYAEEDGNSLLDSKATIGCKVHMHEQKAMHQGLNTDNDSEVLTRNADLMFDVFPPNSRFKKTNPGNPDFSLCVSSNLPPDRAVMEALKTRSKNSPVTIATVDSGRVSFFHFNEVQLPILP